MADKPKTNVDKFFEIYDADPALQARVQQAMDCYPGSLEIRDVMTEHVLLPVAEELGLPFTLKELRNYELLKWGRQHQDRELTDDEMAADDETTYWLLDRAGRMMRPPSAGISIEVCKKGAHRLVRAFCVVFYLIAAGCGCPPHRASRSG